MGNQLVAGRTRALGLALVLALGSFVVAGGGFGTAASAVLVNPVGLPVCDPGVDLCLGENQAPDALVVRVSHTVQIVEPGVVGAPGQVGWQLSLDSRFFKLDGQTSNAGIYSATLTALLAGASTIAISNHCPSGGVPSPTCTPGSSSWLVSILSGHAIVPPPSSTAPTLVVLAPFGTITAGGSFQASITLANGTSSALNNLVWEFDLPYPGWQEVTSSPMPTSMAAQSSATVSWTITTASLHDIGFNHTDTYPLPAAVAYSTTVPGQVSASGYVFLASSTSVSWVAGLGDSDQVINPAGGVSGGAELANLGDTTITSIALSAQGPGGWSVVPGSYPTSLAPEGDLKTSWTVQPPGGVAAGVYFVTAVADFDAPGGPFEVTYPMDAVVLGQGSTFDIEVVTPTLTGAPGDTIYSLEAMATNLGSTNEVLPPPTLTVPTSWTCPGQPGGSSPPTPMPPGTHTINACNLSIPAGASPGMYEVTAAAASVSKSAPVTVGGSGVTVQAPTSAVVGSTVDVTTTITDTLTVRLDLRQIQLQPPVGWTAAITSPSVAMSLAAGKSTQIGWRVTVPATAAPGSYPLGTTLKVQGHLGTIFTVSGARTGSTTLDVTASPCTSPPALSASAVATGGGKAMISWTGSPGGCSPAAMYAVYAYSPSPSAQMFETTNPRQLDVWGLAPNAYWIFTVIGYYPPTGWDRWSSWSTWIWVT